MGADSVVNHIIVLTIVRQYASNYIITLLPQRQALLLRNILYTEHRLTVYAKSKHTKKEECQVFVTIKMSFK